MKRGFSILAIVTALLLSFALYEALIAAPTERTMGDVQRIFYYHVPSAWTAAVLMFANFVASIIYLMTRSPKADAWALAIPGTHPVPGCGARAPRSDSGRQSRQTKMPPTPARRQFFAILQP